MNRSFIILVFSPFMLLPSAVAQEQPEYQDSSNVQIITYTDFTSPDSTFDLPESFDNDLDSLLAQWYADNNAIYDPNCIDGITNPKLSDSVYVQRLSALPTIIDMPYNYYTKNSIDAYMGQNRKVIAYAVSVFPMYDAIFTETFMRYGLPTELKYLAVIESAMKPKAYSHMGAAGMWQFIYSTGVKYGLTVNSLVDDRYDVLKETDAAARYLRDLYVIFGDWHLAISAYNCGPGNVTKAIARSGGKRSFWDIYPFLPRETRGYLPAFIAANYAMTYYKEHGICAIEPTISLCTDTINITRNLHFEQIMHFTGISREELKTLNPQYPESIIPGAYKTLTLTLPSSSISPLLEAGDSLYEYDKERFFSKSKLAVIDDDMKNRPFYITHRIKSGESLSTIAAKYRTTVKKIKEWNKLSNDNIRAGKSLIIYTR